MSGVTSFLQGSGPSSSTALRGLTTKTATGKLFLLCLLVSLLVVYACRSSQVELTNQQKQIAANLAPIVDGYLVLHIEMPGFSGKVFCSHKALDIEDKGKIVTEYVYAICQEYGSRNGNLTKGTGTGIPVVLEVERQGQTDRVVSHQLPGESPRYAEDIRRMFPEKTQDEIFYGKRDELIEEVEQKAKTYYGIKVETNRACRDEEDYSVKL